MLKKIIIKIYSFFIYLFNGFREADKVIMGDKNTVLDNGTKDEQQQQHDSVWQDLVNHELTQRVKDLRYETEHVARESKKYEYIGGGTAQGKTLFDYNGRAENSENGRIIIVQENKEDIGGVLTGSKPIKEYRLKLLYDITPRMRIESYTSRIIVKEVDGGEKIMDIYVSKYHEKYNNKHKFFLSEIKKIVDGFRRSDILDIKKFVFTSNNAFGVDDGVTLTFENISFIDIVEFDGSYILKFRVKLVDEYDYIETVYDKESERKFKNKVARETFRNDIGDVLSVEMKKEADNEYFEKAKEIINNSGS